MKVAEKVEKDLIRDGLHETYNDQIRDFLKRGVAVKLSQDEIDSWTQDYRLWASWFPYDGPKSFLLRGAESIPLQRT